MPRNNRDHLDLRLPGTSILRPQTRRLQCRKPFAAFLGAAGSLLRVSHSWQRFSSRTVFASLCLLLLLGCESRKQESTQQRYEEAKALFEQTTKDLHIPSAEATGAEKQKLQKQAAAAYEQLLKKYPEQHYWAAQALRSLGNIRAAQTHLDEAIKHYSTVEARYSQHDFEVLMAWKSAADLLWEAGRRQDAKAFYQKIVSRFDKPEASQVVKTVVHGSTLRLADGHLPGEL